MGYCLNRVGILYHPMVEASYKKGKELEEHLEARNVAVWLCSAWEGEKAKGLLDKTDLIISVGGDGTILRAAHIAVPSHVPILGVNLGKLGFMTELNADEFMDKLHTLLSGEGWIDERAMLEAELPGALSGSETTVFHALNDVVAARGAVAQLVHIAVSIDGQHLTTYKADGMIVATATGSTGYSLAAGGPILYPQSQDYLMVPIAPHLSPTYPIVLPSRAVLKMHIVATNRGTLSIDGHINLPLPSEATVTVRHSQNTVRFLRVHARDSFYGSLEQKLKGKHN